MFSCGHLLDSIIEWYNLPPSSFQCLVCTVVSAVVSTKDMWLPFDLLSFCQDSLPSETICESFVVNPPDDSTNKIGRAHV